MFQSFDNPSEGAMGAERLARLRAAMTEAGVDGFLVPLADAHQGEYVAPCDARLAWLTGFTGSAGFACALADQATVFVDGRYTVQARNQLDLDAYTPQDWPATQLGAWLISNLSKGTLRFDPWLHTVSEIDGLRPELETAGITLQPGDNLVDQIWEDRPDRPQAPVRIQPDELTGSSHADKRTTLAADLREAGHAAAVMTLTDSTCWLLNIRGGDIPRNPIVQAFSILHADGTVGLFTDAEVSGEVRDHLGDQVRLHPRSAFLDLASDIEGTVVIDPASAPVALRDALAQPVLGADPCVLPKATKTEAEIAGARAAHLRDAVAVIRFLHWIDTTSGQTEISAATQLEEFRRSTGQLLDISFDSIAGTGPNAALPHYRVNTDSDRALSDGDLFLIDSGGQYQDGTTDITRTVPIGTVQARHRAWYTRVLKGVIGIHTIRFPVGTTGEQLDILARAPLWKAGLEFDHGTGHGVGSYLCVHEGPQRICKPRPNSVKLRPGMILSNEPGCYVEGDFGIRLENLIVVRDAAPLDSPDTRPWLEFENLTMVPFDRRLIDTDLLTAEEHDWINAYHAQIQGLMTPRLDAESATWLAQACAPL